MRRLVFMFFALPMVVSCTPSPQAAAPAQATIPGANTMSMHDAVVRMVPIGTPIAEAQATMQAQGFTCRDSRNALVCEHLEPLQPGINRIWTATLLHDADKITGHTISASILTQPAAREASRLPPPPQRNR